MTPEFFRLRSELQVLQVHRAHCARELATLEAGGRGRTDEISVRADRLREILLCLDRRIGLAIVAINETGAAWTFPSRYGFRPVGTAVSVTQWTRYGGAPTPASGTSGETPQAEAEADGLMPGQTTLVTGSDPFKGGAAQEPAPEIPNFRPVSPFSPNRPQGLFGGGRRLPAGRPPLALGRVSLDEEGTPPYFGEWGIPDPEGRIVDGGRTGPFPTAALAFRAAGREARKAGARRMPLDGFAQVVDARGRAVGPVT